MAKPAPSLADTIGAALPPRPRCKPWWERIEPATLAELETVRERFRAGGYDTSKRTLARTISAHLKAAGICDIGEQGVLIWLNAK
jgi:hypothetical protein